MKHCTNGGVQNDDNNKSCRKISLLIILALVIAAAFAGAAWLNTGARLADRQIYSGEKYLAEHKYQEAVRTFTKAIEIEPNQTDASLGLADAYLVWEILRKRLKH